MTHDPSNEQEHQLLTEIRAGQTDAMARYLQLRRPELLGVILKRMGPALRSRIEAEDIFQEVSAAAIANMQQMDFSDRTPFGWLCELAERRIIDADRRFSARKRSDHGEVGIDAGGDRSQAGIANLLVASITSPSKAFSRKQKEFRILRAMEQLPEEQRQVLRMRYAEGRQPREIAREIGKSDGATRVLLTRALKKLKQLVDTEPDGPVGL